LRLLANNENTLTTDQRINILQIDGAVIAGALIFLTISSFAVVLPPPFLVPAKADITLIYKAVSFFFALTFIGPFAVSAICILLRKDRVAIDWMITGFIIIPSVILIITILYLLAGNGIIHFLPSPSKGT
jgi:hypothetical protein